MVSIRTFSLKNVGISSNPSVAWKLESGIFVPRHHGYVLHKPVRRFKELSSLVVMQPQQEDLSNIHAPQTVLISLSSLVIIVEPFVEDHAVCASLGACSIDLQCSRLLRAQSHLAHGLIGQSYPADEFYPLNKFGVRILVSYPGVHFSGRYMMHDDLLSLPPTRLGMADFKQWSRTIITWTQYLFLFRIRSQAFCALTKIIWPFFGIAGHNLVYLIRYVLVRGGNLEISSDWASPKVWDLKMRNRKFDKFLKVNGRF